MGGEAELSIGAREDIGGREFQEHIELVEEDVRVATFWGAGDQ